MVDAVIKIVQESLWNAWFPGGHTFELTEDDRARQDYDAWQEISWADAKVAVDALVEKGLICNTAQNVYDSQDVSDK